MQEPYIETEHFQEPEKCKPVTIGFLQTSFQLIERATISSKAANRSLKKKKGAKQMVFSLES